MFSVMLVVTLILSFSLPAAADTAVFLGTPNFRIKREIGRADEVQITVSGNVRTAECVDNGQTIKATYDTVSGELRLFEISVNGKVNEIGTKTNFYMELARNEIDSVMSLGGNDQVLGTQGVSSALTGYRWNYDGSTQKYTLRKHGNTSFSTLSTNANASYIKDFKNDVNTLNRNETYIIAQIGGTAIACTVICKAAGVSVFSTALEKLLKKAVSKNTWAVLLGALGLPNLSTYYVNWRQALADAYVDYYNVYNRRYLGGGSSTR